MYCTSCFFNRYDTLGGVKTRQNFNKCIMPPEEREISKIYNTRQFLTRWWDKRERSES